MFITKIVLSLSINKISIKIKKNMNELLFEFREKGFIHLKNVIKPEEFKITRNLAIELKIKYAEFEGQPRENGSGYFWKGLEMASTLDDRLYPQYTSDTMIELAKMFLEVEEPYLFNDQVVVKLSNEIFAFEPHFDNQYGINPEAALRGEFKTINFCQILTDMPIESGPISCLNNKTNEWETITAKAGDIIAIEGNTIHGSTLNTSNNIRVVYACVYSTHPIGNFQKGFYNHSVKK